MILGCNVDDDSSYKIFLEAQNQKSKFKIIIENYTYWTWANLYEEDGLSALSSGFLWGINEPIPASEKMPEFNGSPPISETFASEQALVKAFPAKQSVTVKWNNEGSSVLILIDGIPFCLLDATTKRCFTKAVKKSGPFGEVWNDSILTKFYKKPL